MLSYRVIGVATFENILPIKPTTSGVFRFDARKTAMRSS